MQFGQLKRREFITVASGAAICAVTAGHAQQPANTIGFLGASTRSAESQWIAALLQRLRELGWIDGRNIVIEYRWAEGHDERLAEIAAEFVHLKVSIIVTWGTPATIAARQATSVIPVVAAAMGDPLATGIAVSLARPGGNVTGLSVLGTDLAGKRLELLREVVPNLRRLAILANIDNPATVIEMSMVQTAARTLGLEVVTSEIRQSKDIAVVFDVLKSGVDALYVCSDPVVTTNMTSINILAATARVPTMHARREYVEAGGLISYGPNFRDQFRRAGDYVDKILRGAKPAEIPIQQPIQFELVINLTTAKAIGVDVPFLLLQRADEVIE